MFKNGLFIFVFIKLLTLSDSVAQQWSYVKENHRANIPFEIINNVILLPVILNGERLSFILDTGVKETFLFAQVDSMVLQNTTHVNFKGLGVSDGIRGILSRGNSLILGDSIITDKQHHLYVIVDSSINLSRNIGVPVHGVLGSTLFRNNIIRIDYIKKRIEIVNQLKDLKIKRNKYDRLSLTIINDRPYVDADIHGASQVYINKRLLVDLGNSDPMLLFADRLANYKMELPIIHEYLGQGLSGKVFGIKNRIKYVKFGSFSIMQPVVSYPDSLSFHVSRIAEGRVGSIGNQIMSRFDVIFDYGNSVLYLRKNKTYGKPFYTDLSGIEIEQSGLEWVQSDRTLSDNTDWNFGQKIEIDQAIKFHVRLEPIYHITQIAPKSSAYKIGLAVGDQLIRVNGRVVGKLSLSEIRAILQSAPHKKIKIEIKRNAIIQSYILELRDELPITDY